MADVLREIQTGLGYMRTRPNTGVVQAGGRPTPPWRGRSPEVTWGNSNEERLVNEALSAAEIPGEQIAQLAPPLPQIDPFRPRLGYPTEALRIEDVLALERLYSDRRDAFSGGPHSWTASPRMAESPF